MRSSGTWPARCAVTASASCPAIASASRSRHTTSIARASSTGTADLRQPAAGGGEKPAVSMRERALISAIERVLGRRDGSRVVRWIGDDAAVIRADGAQVVSLDVMVEGTHFRLGRDCSAADAGHRALAGALSDIAAMGAAPGEAYLGRSEERRVGKECR